MESIRMSRHLDECSELTPELAEIVVDVQEKSGYNFCPVEIEYIFAYTQRKCEINGKDESYVPILFENELRDYLMRGAINIMNMQKMVAVG